MSAPTEIIPAVHARLPTLTGMRFLAALLVFVFHAATVFDYPDQQTAADVGWLTGKLAFLGVSFFFVLSGFVLSWSARAGDTAARFWRRRACKVYPNHLVTFLLAVALLLALHKPVTGWWQNLLLIHAWFPDQTIFNSANVVSWSLACEAVFYLLFPVLHRWFGRIPSSTLWWWASGLVVVVLCMPLLAQALVPATGGDPTQPGSSLSQVWFLYIFPPVCLLQFMLGMIMASIVLSGRWIGLPLPLAAVLLAGGYALALVVPYNFGVNATTIVPVALVIAAAAVADVRGRATLLRGRVAVWLGEVSFAFYLVHYLVLLHGRELTGLRGNGEVAVELAVLTGAMALSLGLAWLLYAGVERPVMRRWSRPRRSARPPAPPQSQPRPPQAQRGQVTGPHHGVPVARGSTALQRHSAPVAKQPRPREPRW
ncbi:peptidoglycan/LPS O-acetylase OafA/YrhL [Saccharomonospora amisosensis]|uniref:Peptidoglycan/LPS O-acetylase OafA/YrhL n=1 Tax=Saccharomonospora amisosensis TaxID=1128677 RepID=A0A7X5UNV9_9PSEU|nr:acyltransferase [Saccharomonospora amisosensis]NIJ11212.1 peptidoglycan/LPS O-acetylase OafA/YrhL [Saccharomonospora amisosensis]